MDTGSLQKAQAETIRILVWVLSFLSFGYATREFEVTSERLGVYRPEEHIDNPKDYNDNADARSCDPRLRGPIRDIELQIDPETGMKNYIANEKGDWATSAAYVKYSFTQSIHHGRLYCNGHGFFKGKDEDLAEALRCMGQGLHTLEDFGAHTNYIELALREIGFQNVFPHVGTNTQINVRGHHVFPLVTGTFGMVDFLHSVLGEATDHFTQSEVNEMDNALGTAETAAHSSSPLTTLVKLLAKVPGTKELCTEAEDLQRRSDAQARQSNQPQWGTRGMDQPEYEANRAQGDWNQYPGQQWTNQQPGYAQPPPPPPPGWDQGFQGHPSFQQPPPPPPPEWGQQPPPYQWEQQQPSGFDQQQSQATQLQSTDQGGEKLGSGIPGISNIDPQKTIAQIYPILEFRDKVVRTISSIIEKIPGLEALVDKITETLTVFILSLLAPFVRPIISAVSKSLQTGSSTVIDASAKHQYEPWTDPNCTNPTHSFLSKDHFSNILNEPAGNVAAEIVKYVAPRILHAWQDTSIPIERVMDDVMKVFHHPALRDHNIEVHRSMFSAVQKWADQRPDRRTQIDNVLSSDGVRNGKNQSGPHDHTGQTHNHLPSNAGGFGDMGLPFGTQPGQNHSQPQPGGWSIPGFGAQQQHHQQQQQQGGGFTNPLNSISHLPIPGLSNVNNEINKYSNKINKYSHYIPGFNSSSNSGRRDLDDSEIEGNQSSVPQQQGYSHDQGQEYGMQNQDQNPPSNQQASSGYPGHGGESSGYYGGSGTGGQGDGYYRS
ncbi:putative het-c domain protein [Phaeomoniella chlamydospora]|uniref:Putative het-c domain protein n=1 Tax=Phaeomoniella chlamydospora TaxID=158046 RepID=A0A0G2F0B5_PHACM|nr:putative het-c domain protein [Phaeomoniella chlamydospora]